MKQQRTQNLNQERVEQEYDRFFALSSDILAVVGFDGYFKRVSPACERILGFSQTELLTTPFLEFVHPDDRAATIAVVQKLVTGERVDHFENRYCCKQGFYKWLSWSGIAAVEEELIYCTARDITGQKQTEETLQQSKQYYEALIHSLNSIIWEFDLQTQQFVFVSSKAEDILGYPIEQWLTEANFWENHIHPEDREQAINGCHQFVLQRQEGQLEYRMVAADGSIVWLHDIVSLVVEADQPVKLRGVLTDITELQRTKESLDRREQELRTLVENSPDVIIRIDRNFRYLYANPKIEERTGISAAHHIGKTSEELGFPDDLVTLWNSTAQQVFETRQEQWMEFESPNGRIFNHSRLVPEFAVDGSVESVLIVVRDITEHKQLEVALQESEARFRAFMQHSPMPAWITDSDGRIIYLNENCYQVSHHLTQNPIGKTVADVYPEEVAQPLLENIRQVAETQQILEAIETIPRADGTYGEFLVYKFPILNLSGNCLVGGVAVDITELKRTEAALRESEARYRTLASYFPNGVVLLFDHDLRYVLADGLELEEINLSKAELEGRTIWEVLPPETCELVEPFYRAALAGRASVAEIPFAEQVYLVHFLPIQNEGEQVAAGMVMTQNITERKWAEAELRESEERFRQIAENIREVFWIADLGFTQIIYISPAYEEIWGRTCSSLYEQPKSFFEAIHPEDKNQVITVLEQQRQTGFSHEYRIVQPNGSVRWIWERASVVNDSASNPYRVVGVSQDITERKRAEEALKLADFSFDRSAFAAVWIGSDAQILRVNEGASRMLGYSREELQSKYVYELDPNFSQEEWPKHWQLLQQQKTISFISQLQRKDSSLVPIEVTLNYLKFNDQEYNFAFARDISERLQAEATLRYQREQERLVVAIAQQIRQSLNLEEILGKTVTAVRAFLQSDRVLIYHLDPAIGGSVIAESVENGWIVTLGTTINDCYFTQSYAHLYQQGRVHAVDDIYTANLAPCHLELLAQFQVRANLAVPIAQEDKLWGLLVVQQCSAPRHWQPLEINLLKQLAMQVAIATQQSELYQKAQAEIAQRQLVEAALRQQSEHERLIADISNRIRQSLNLDDVLSVTVTEVRQVLDADRVLVFRLHPDGSGSVVKEAVLPEYPVTKEMRWVDECFPAECYEFYRQGNTRIVPDVATDDWGACLVEFMQSVGVKSKVVAPIVQASEESGESVVWGLLIAHACAHQRQWQPIEAELLQRLTDKLTIAIQQAELHQQVQQLNTNLEIQVQERTLELQQALEFEALLKRITDKVRDSLDEAQILQTAVEELAIGFKVQCCDTALYDLEQQTSTVYFEYITGGLPPAKGQTFSFANLPGVYVQLLQGQYVQFTTVAVPDFWRGGIAPQFTVLCCPMMTDQRVLGDLWLFRPPEDSFNDLEVRLVEQVANHCAIALRQSRLYQAAQTQVIELERLNRLKDDFLSTVSHELRTPMSNIKMAIQMLEVIRSQTNPETPEPERAKRYFNILRSECEREISLINDLLDLTRLDAATEPLNLVSVDLRSWIPRVVEPFEERVCNQQQHLKINVSAKVPPITTDLSYLERILTELLNNACKYTPAGEQIVISAKVTSSKKRNRETPSSSVLITVSNSGVEIPGNELERIFDKFYRVPNNDPWRHGGTGLGLALVKRLVERMNGKIEASSNQKETKFTVQLPLINPELPSV